MGGGERGGGWKWEIQYKCFKKVECWVLEEWGEVWGANNDPEDVHRNCGDCGGTCTWHWFSELGIRTEIDSGVLS